MHMDKFDKFDQWFGSAYKVFQNRIHKTNEAVHFKSKGANSI